MHARSSTDRKRKVDEFDTDTPPLAQPDPKTPRICGKPLAHLNQLPLSPCIFVQSDDDDEDAGVNDADPRAAAPMVSVSGTAPTASAAAAAAGAGAGATAPVSTLDAYSALGRTAVAGNAIGVPTTTALPCAQSKRRPRAPTLTDLVESRNIPITRGDFDAFAAGVHARLAVMEASMARIDAAVTAIASHFR